MTRKELQQSVESNNRRIQEAFKQIRDLEHEIYGLKNKPKFSEGDKVEASWFGDAEIISPGELIKADLGFAYGYSSTYRYFIKTESGKVHSMFEFQLIPAEKPKK